MSVTEQPIEFKTQDGIADGFLYADGKPRPAVIQLQDIMGVRDANRAMARRLAEAGYTVLLPNQFYRTGRPPMFDFELKFGEERTMKRFGKLTGPLTLEAQERDIGAYIGFLEGEPSAARGKLGVAGYCFTGQMAMRAAAWRPDKIGAAASFHGGGLCSDAPTSPHLLLPKVKAHLYFGHAIEDRGMPPEAIEKLEEALRAWAGEFENETYEGARHGWTIPGSQVFNERQANRAFDKLTGMLARALP